MSTVTPEIACETALVCPLCAQASRPWLSLPGDWRNPAHPRPFQLAWCDACAYGELTPRPSLADLASFYDVEDYYTHHAPQTVEATRTLADRVRVHLAWRADRRREEEIVPASVERHGVRAPGRLCDIGCGNGGLMRRMAAAGFDVVGLEPDADACRTATAGGLRVVRGSAEDVPAELAGERFDCVTMTHVLEHTLDPLAAVENIAGLLTSGGTFFVETPNNACRGLRAAGTTWRWLDVPRHVNFFTPQSLQAVCERAGLEVVGIEYTGYVRQFQHDWISDEQEIRRRLETLAAGPEPTSPAFTRLPPANNAWRAAVLLARTCFAADEAKYDSVRVIARKR